MICATAFTRPTSAASSSRIPIGFRGERTNLYRYCRNNPVTRLDRFGLQDAVTLPEGFSATVPEVRVTGTEPIEPIEPIDHSRNGGTFGRLAEGVEPAREEAIRN